MSVTAPRTPPTRHRGVDSQPVTVRTAITSEWVKFRTLRSSAAMLAGASIGMVAIGMIVGWNTRRLSRSLDPEDIVPSAVLQGYFLGQLLIGALGVLFVSGEYSTGMIRSTMAAVPRRIPVLMAKFVVFVTVTSVTIIPCCLVAFVAAQSIISRYRTGFSLSDPGALRLVLGTGIYLVCIGVIGASCGWLVRNTPGALVTYFAIILVLPGIFANVLGNWGKDIAQYFPSEAGRSFVSSLHLPTPSAPGPDSRCSSPGSSSDSPRQRSRSANETSDNQPRSRLLGPLVDALSCQGDHSSSARYRTR